MSADSAHLTIWSRRRGLLSRGSVVTEFALVMPIFFAIIGLCIVVGLSCMARMQMMALANQATRACAIDRNYTPNTVAGCVVARVAQMASQPAAFVAPCDLQPAYVSGPSVISSPYAPYPIYQIRTTLQCTYQTGLSLVGLVPGNPVPSSITLVSTATVPYLPRMMP